MSAHSQTIPPIKTYLLIAGTIIAGTCALSACATPTGPPPDPRDVALHQSHNAIVSGIDDATEESAAVDEFVVRARKNACRCDAPPDEIYIHERWTRVYFQGDEKLLGTLKNTLSKDKDRAAQTTVRVRGSLSGDTRKSERGIAYPIFVALAIE